MERYSQQELCEDRLSSLKRPLDFPALSYATQSSFTDLNPRKRQCTTEAVADCSTDPIYLSPLSTNPNCQDFKRSWSASPSQFCTGSISIPSTPGTEASSPIPSTNTSTPNVTTSNGTSGEGTEENLDLEVECMNLDIGIRVDDVCIGMFLSQPIPIDARGLNSQDPESAFPVFIGRKSTHATMPVCSSPQPSAPILGYLDTRTSQILDPLLDRALVRIQSFVDPKHHKNAKTGALGLCINLYAAERVVGKLGEYLQTNRICLQHPLLPIPDIPYHNPHFLTKPGTTLTTTAFRKQFESDQTQAASSREENPTLVISTLNTKGDFERLLDTFSQNSHVFKPVTQDPAILTPLLPHQIDALSFMIQRETVRQFSFTNGESSCGLWKRESVNQRNLYHNIITEKAQLTTPRESPGGLLADHMGLGKTLSILSLIVHTLPNPVHMESAGSNSGHDHANGTGKLNTTLVITKKSILPQWDEQVRQHIKPGRLQSLIYYGDNRKAIGIRDLAGHDVVFTTYDTVQQEWITSQKHAGAKTEGLHGVHWFRVVLDEGHEIRNRTTQKAQAINALSAERRWCVTGTPIQNTLGDMAAVLLFLRLEPFDNYHTFRDHILKPLKRGEQEGLGRLRSLIDSFMLRRVKGTVKLPSRVTYTKIVELKPRERCLYEKNLQQSKYLLDKAIETKGGDVQASSALEIILRLRLICDHGLDLLPICNGSEDAQAQELLNEDVAVELQLYDTAAVCVNKISTDTYNPLSLYQDLYCHEPQLQTPKISVMHSCDSDGDIAMSGWNLDPRLNTNHGIHIGGPNNVHVHEKFPHYKGPSSKVRALIDVLQNPKEDWLHAHGPIKSVVFSVWTRMLDLVSIAFDNQRIKYCRLDGSMSATARNTSIAQFKSDPEITVILVSLMAGGVGLNLTVASQVHLLEPHWNPMIEEQALDRVHRIGQRNNVQVFRYLVKDSFENSVIELQKKKLGLVHLGMEKLTKQDLRVEKLKVRTYEDFIH